MKQAIQQLMVFPAFLAGMTLIAFTTLQVTNGIKYSQATPEEKECLDNSKASFKVSYRICVEKPLDRINELLSEVN